MEIKKIIEDAHDNAIKHGFWEDIEDLDLMLEDGIIDEHYDCIRQAFISQYLMLIVGEVAEAQESLRKGDKDNFAEELADICIRVFDLCGGLDIDLETEILMKMEKNKLRPYKHGKQF